MQLVLSVAAETALDDWQASDQDTFELAVTDLQLLELEGLGELGLDAMVASWIRVTGPTGRVSYWIAPHQGDTWLIETIDVH